MEDFAWELWGEKFQVIIRGLSTMKDSMIVRETWISDLQIGKEIDLEGLFSFIRDSQGLMILNQVSAAYVNQVFRYLLIINSELAGFVVIIDLEKAYFSKISRIYIFNVLRAYFSKILRVHFSKILIAVKKNATKNY